MTALIEQKDRLLNASSKQELEEIISIFNLDIAKKNVLRSAVYSDLVDKVIAEMGERIDKVPGQFSNKELLDYVTVLQTQLSKSSLESKELPTIAIQQNIVNVASPLSQFDRESKDRMREALKEILQQLPEGEIIENESIQDGLGVDRGIQESNILVQDEEQEYDLGQCGQSDEF